MTRRYVQNEIWNDLNISRNEAVLNVGDVRPPIVDRVRLTRHLY